MKSNPLIDRPFTIFLGPQHAFEEVDRNFGAVLDLEKCPLDPMSFQKLLKKADAVIDASMKLAIGHEEITKASRLRLISTATTGSDHIATDACAGRGITVRTLREDNDFLQEITPAAEHTWALLLGLIRNLPGAVAHVRQGAWDRERFPSFLLDGKTMGIVGFGRLGAKVAQFARAFNMEIIAYDPLVTNWPTFVSSISLEKLFSQADVISLHVHLTEETKSFINAPLLAQIRPGAFLINTSRGGLIDETALLDGLRTGRIRGAALDVMNGEPAVAQSPLVEFARNNPNLIITPHCAGYSPEAVDKVCIRAASKVVEFFRSNSKDD